MLGAIIRSLLRIRNYERIPKLPRGMLATDYETISREDARVMARLGARSPSGVKLAVKRAGVESVEDLIRELQHYRPQRNIARRWNRMLCRLFDASDDHPHRQAVIEDARRSRRRRNNSEIEERLKAFTTQVHHRRSTNSKP